MDTTARRLTKSRSERMIDGVCGGIAEYFHLDVTLVRLSWVLLTLFGGVGLLLYIMAMIIMPAGPAVPATAQAGPTVRSSTRFWGILLIAVGGLWLLNNLDIFHWHHWWGFSWSVTLPVLMILAGVAFIYGGRNYVSAAEPGGTPSETPAGEGEAQTPLAPGTTQSPLARKLYRSRTERKLFGVCGGLGGYFGMDPTIIRLVFVVMALASFGFVIVLYILMAIIVPEEPAAIQLS